VKLEFTPIVNEDGTIRLKVAPEVSALDYTNTVTIGGFTVPALSSRRAETEVELRSNQSFAISGLLDQRTTDILDKTPGAANIPILGALFKSKNINHTQTELVVVITPTVVDPLSEMAAPSEPELPIPTMNQEKYDESLGKRRNPQPAAPPIVPDTPPDSIPPVFPHSAPAPAKAPAAGAAQNVAPPAVPPAAAPAPIPVPRLQNAPAAPAAKPAATRAAKPANAAVAVPPQPTPNPAKAPAAQPARAVPVAIPSAPKAAAPSAPNAASTLSAPGAAPSQPAGAVPAAGVGGAKAAAPAAAAAPPNAPVLAADRPAANPIPAAQPVAAATPAQPPSRPRIVEVMTLSHEADADAMVDALKRRGYDVAVNRDPKDSLLHLDVGPFTSVSDAETMRQRLLQDGYNAVVK
jgi:hypothetical protein